MKKSIWWTLINFLFFSFIKVSKACTSLCMWVHAMYKYYFINQIVAPKKAALKVANEKLAEVQKVLDKTKAKMAEVNDFDLWRTEII